MAQTWTATSVDQIKVGDTVRVRGEYVLEVARIEDEFMGRPGMLAFIQDNPSGWFKAPVAADAEVEVLS